MTSPGVLQSSHKYRNYSPTIFDLSVVNISKKKFNKCLVKFCTVDMESFNEYAIIKVSIVFGHKYAILF